MSAILAMAEMCRDYYRHNPEHLLLYDNFPEVLLKSLDYNCNPSEDRYAWFRRKYGPIYLPFGGENSDDFFFSEFIGKILESDRIMNIESFFDGENMHYDLLELMNHLHHALMMYDNNRECGESHQKLLEGPQGI